MLKNFYKKTMAERRKILTNLGFQSMDTLAGRIEHVPPLLDRMSENVIGALRLPLGVVPGLRVDGKPHWVALATEEPSVVAALARVARLIDLTQGVKTHVSQPATLAQILVQTDAPQTLRANLLEHKARYLACANACDPVLVAHGGGAYDLQAEILEDPRLKKATVFATFWVHTGDAMGANAVNTMAESVMAEIQKDWNAEPGLAILSNDGQQRRVQAQITIPFEALQARVQSDPQRFAERIQMASIFAEKNPQRAVTHNKGILNGVVAAAQVLGQDTRALCAAALDFACKSGQHRPLSTWRLAPQALIGELDMPLCVGFVGGGRNLPAVQSAFQFDRIANYQELCGVLAAVGLAQNLGALWALVTTGIQAGHMALHARKMASPPETSENPT